MRHQLRLLEDKYAQLEKSINFSVPSTLILRNLSFLILIVSGVNPIAKSLSRYLLVFLDSQQERKEWIDANKAIEDTLNTTNAHIEQVYTDIGTGIYILITLTQRNEVTLFFFY